MLLYVRFSNFCATFRDRRPGTLDVHPSQNALVLNYELEVQILGGDETVLYGEKTVSYLLYLIFIRYINFIFVFIEPKEDNRVTYA